MRTTKEIERSYNISRQTIQSWIKNEIIQKPLKDWKGKYIWTLENENEIKTLIDNKEQEINRTDQIGDSEKYIDVHNRRYLGSKKKLLGFIEETVSTIDHEVDTIADIFGGTGVVANHFRKNGKRVIVNDILYSNYINYLTWFGNEEINNNKVRHYIDELNSIKGIENYVSENFGNKYFSYENAKKIGTIREAIDRIVDVNERERAFLLTSLLYAMDKVANTVGHYDAFRRKMDSLSPMVLRMPIEYFNHESQIFCKDANELVREISADLIYIDTPYNSRQYSDSYHLIENIATWKKPELTGIALKMVDRSNIKSLYSTNKAAIAFHDLVTNIEAKYILVSYNNMANKGNGRSNAKISNEEIIEILSLRGKVTIHETNFAPFSTGKSIILNHKELLYLCKVDN